MDIVTFSLPSGDLLGQAEGLLLPSTCRQNDLAAGRAATSRAAPLAPYQPLQSDNRPPACPRWPPRHRARWRGCWGLQKRGFSMSCGAPPYAIPSCPPMGHTPSPSRSDVKGQQIELCLIVGIMLTTVSEANGRVRATRRETFVLSSLGISLACRSADKPLPPPPDFVRGRRVIARDTRKISWDFLAGWLAGCWGRLSCLNAGV